MKKVIEIIGIIVIVAIFTTSCFLLYKFVNKISHEDVDTSYMWNIKYLNMKITEGSKKGKVMEKDEGINLHVTLSKPKEFYELTFDVTNKGTLKAYIADIVKEIVSTDDILKCQISYLDNSEIQKGDILLPKQTKTIKIRIEYPKTKTKIYKKLQLVLNFKLIYKAQQ